MKFDLTEDERAAVIGAIRLRLKNIANSAEPHHATETAILFQTSKKNGARTYQRSGFRGNYSKSRLDLNAQPGIPADRQQPRCFRPPNFNVGPH